jgi:hypothetical protein
MIKHMFGRLDRSWRPPHQGADEKGSCVSDQEAWPSFIFKGLKGMWYNRWIRKGVSCRSWVANFSHDEVWMEEGDFSKCWKGVTYVGEVQKGDVMDGPRK